MPEVKKKTEKQRAYTAEEVRDMILEHSVGLARYWAAQPNMSVQSQCEGVVFSMLVMLDGGSADLPGFTLTPKPHEDDKAFCQSQGQNWFESVVIDDALHEHLHRFVK
jgi:hypothetical protein